MNPKLFLTIALLLIGYWAFYELNGAWGRWRSGRPILKSADDAQIFAEAKEREAKRKSEVYAAYEADPHRLDRDPAFYIEFKKYWDWSSVRAEVVREWSREADSCTACGKKVFNRINLHVDHIQPRSKYPHLRYLKSNLQILCSRCNLRKHDYDGDDWEDVIAQRDKEKRRIARKKYYKKRKAILHK